MASFRVEARVEGVEDLQKALMDLKRSVRRKILTRAIRRAHKDVVTKARQLVPVKSSLLKKSIGAKVKVYAAKGAVVAVIGPRKGFRKEVAKVKTKKGMKHLIVTDKVNAKLAGKGQEAKRVIQDPVKYAHLVELGTARYPAKPFLRPALFDQKDHLANLIMQEVAAGIEEEAAKAKQ